MTPDIFLSIIDQGLRHLRAIGGPAITDGVRRELLTIALQESGPDLNARYQGSPADDPGPARGFWQFEEGGGCVGVLTHPASADLAAKTCLSCAVVATSSATWRALEGNDILAVSFARLLLFTDPAEIPHTQTAGWDCYVRCWRPGAPHPETWTQNWRVASEAVRRNPH